YLGHAALAQLLLKDVLSDLTSLHDDLLANPAGLEISRSRSVRAKSRAEGSRDPDFNTPVLLAAAFGVVVAHRHRRANSLHLVLVKPDAAGLEDSLHDLSALLGELAVISQQSLGIGKTEEDHSLMNLPLVQGRQGPMDIGKGLVIEVCAVGPESEIDVHAQ